MKRGVVNQQKIVIANVRIIILKHLQAEVIRLAADRDVAANQEITRQLKREMRGVIAVVVVAVQHRVPLQVYRVPHLEHASRTRQIKWLYGQIRLSLILKTWKVIF